MATDEIALPLRLMIEGLDHAVALRRATAALIQRIATRPRQALDDGTVYVELSIGFVARAARTSYGTSWTAWHAVLGVVGWQSIAAREAERSGAVLRVLASGRRWGQHLRLTRSALAALEEVAHLVVSRGWVEDYVETQPPGATREIDIVRGKSARCPWHDDRRPSMIVNWREDGHTALAVCMACEASDGRRLSAHVAPNASGGWTARLSASTLRWWTGSEIDPDLDEGPVRPCAPTAAVAHEAAPWPASSLPTEAEAETERVEVSTAGRSIPGALDLADDEEAPGSVVLGRLDGAALQGAQARGGLLAVLRRADARSLSTSETRDAWTSAARAARGSVGDDLRAFLADRLVGVQRMAVATRRALLRRGVEVSIPDRWRPTAQEWVLLDLDRLGRGLGTRTASEVSALVEEVRSIATGDGWLRGDFAVVETSTSGVQVWLRLRTACDPIALASSRLARAWLRGLGRRVVGRLAAIGCGDSTLDESAWGVHRFGRRPGWRLLADGSPFRSRLIFAEDSDDVR
jgi:hypothetical protein